ncbi:hypothetical protein [Legionella hackeliae]|uniref:Secreted protein n=1 Tax=Legionella hackeliae TaxID=449 RepID=A0A0A8UXS9_LEGHA|nr:hypothetical protein [Legionella hackeliae]KTD13140.1 hypothetical protein Lhac_1009 [Legionella hackeliae]CEK11549.1 conserved exported protein of unknown function [Legionella hackeliae]STX48320.1 Uncharacterised protein [Legionella hackeliae]
MLRKTTVVAMTSLLLSAPCFSGLYLGASVGPEGASFTQSAYVTRPNTFSVVDRNHFSGLGVFGSILVVMHGDTTSFI